MAKKSEASQLGNEVDVDPHPFSIDGQIEEVKREIKLREKIYPYQVRSGKMRESVADYHLERMRAVLRTLQWLQTNRDRIVRHLCQAGIGAV